MLEYLFIAFIVIFCIHIFYYVFIFSSFAFTKQNSEKKAFNKPVSVIICAKNEAENITENLPLLITQNYTDFELVLVNDASTDTTLEVMEDFQQKHSSKIKIVNVVANEQFWGSKKYALTLGIKAASFENLLFIDADCKPASNNWIAEMTSNFSTKHQLILGYGAYEKIKNSFLNKLIRFETLFTALQYFSYAKIGLPYMGVGRNLAYTKQLFFNVKGFANHIHIKSGDDDLFVNQVATKKNTSYCITNESFTISKPKTTFKDWILQKRRHISTANNYKLKHKILLSLFYISQFFFWLLCIVLISFLYKWQFALLLLAIKLLTQYIIVGSIAKKLNETDLIFFIPFFELFLISTQLFIFIKNLISKPTHW